MTTLQFVALIAVASVFGLGCIVGYEKGVKDTEKRWQDAVAKGEWDRKYRRG